MVSLVEEDSLAPISAVQSLQHHALGCVQQQTALLAHQITSVDLFLCSAT